MGKVKISGVNMQQTKRSLGIVVEGASSLSVQQLVVHNGLEAISALEYALTAGYLLKRVSAVYRK